MKKLGNICVPAASVFILDPFINIMARVHSKKLDQRNPIKPQQKQKDVQQKEKQKEKRGVVNG